MRALVIGASGQVGGALMKALKARGHEATGTYRSFPIEGYVRLDLNDSQSVQALVERERPDWIFCTAGMTNADACEEQPEAARREIVGGPLGIARLGQKIGAGFVFYSSAYVFDGKSGPYAEEHAPSPINIYGKCKYEAEKIIQSELERWVIVRTVVVYGPEAQGKNFAYQVLRAARSSTKIAVPVDQVSNTTYNEDLALASVELTERNISGLYHLAGSDDKDRYSLGRLICEIFGFDSGFLEPRRTTEINQRAPRPLLAGLVTSRAQRELKTVMRAAREGLIQMKHELGNGVAGPGRSGIAGR